MTNASRQPDGTPWPPNARSARVIQVIEVVTKEGTGTTDDIVREVTRYYSTDGELLATNDPTEREVRDLLAQTRDTFERSRLVSGVQIPPRRADETIT